MNNRTTGKKGGVKQRVSGKRGMGTTIKKISSEGELNLARNLEGNRVSKIS